MCVQSCLLLRFEHIFEVAVVGAHMAFLPACATRGTLTSLLATIYLYAATPTRSILASCICNHETLLQDGTGADPWTIRQSVAHSEKLPAMDPTVPSHGSWHQHHGQRR